MSPSGVELRCRMCSYHLAFGFTFMDHLLHAATDGHDHSAKGFHTRSVGHISSRGNNTESAARPGAERFNQSIQVAALRRVNHWISVTRKYLAQVNRVSHVEMHDRVRVTVPGRLMDDMNSISIDVEGQNFREEYARTVNTELNQPRRS